MVVGKVIFGYRETHHFKNNFSDVSQRCGTFNIVKEGNLSFFTLLFLSCGHSWKVICFFRVRVFCPCFQPVSVSGSGWVKVNMWDANCFLFSQFVADITTLLNGTLAVKPQLVQTELLNCCPSWLNQDRLVKACTEVMVLLQNVQPSLLLFKLFWDMTVFWSQNQWNLANMFCGVSLVEKRVPS